MLSGMPTVVLPAPLRRYTGGVAEHTIEAPTVSAALSVLAQRHPELRGFMLDERGTLRRHLSVFVNGTQERAETTVQTGDRVMVLTSISGGSGTVEILVGTKKGLVVLRGPRGGDLEVAGRAFSGMPVEYAIRDPRSGRYLASLADPHFGPRVFGSDDPCGEWEPSDGPVFPEDTETAVTRIWVIQPGERDGELWAGVDPAALFRSVDGGSTWELVRSLWDHPVRQKWVPGAGGLCLHTICPWPGEPDRLMVGVSAGGVWITDDGGATWVQGNAGLRAPYMPPDVTPTTEFCVHHVERSPSMPERLYMQFHGGVHRSDDGGHSWVDIAPGLPSSFGFPIVVDPSDADRAFVIPLSADTDRVTPGGRASVWATGDAGATWSERADGLPAADAYLTILRQAFCHDGRSPLGLYFGATSGELFASDDGGGTWSTAARRLPPILSVRAA